MVQMYVCKRVREQARECLQIGRQQVNTNTAVAIAVAAVQLFPSTKRDANFYVYILFA